MRRALIYPALLVAVLLAPVGAAEATPTVTLKVTPLPIPGFAGTGNILGAGADVETKSTISGTEYGGFPYPLVGLTFDAPAGTNVTFAGFPTCAPATLEADGPAGCSKQSMAGPPGEGLGIVSFGAEQVRERVSIQAYFGPDDGLLFYADGSTPASFQIVEKGHWVSATAPFGPKLIVEVPLVETVPGADYVSILSFKVEVGAAYRQGRKTISYLTLPKKCSKDGLAIKTELKFENSETVTIPQREPCPRR
jgi:hypothetical protein